MEVYSYKQRRNILIVMILSLGALLIYSMAQILSGVVGAIVVYILHKRHFKYLTLMKKWKRSSAALVIILFSILVLIIPVTAVSWMLVEKFIYFKDHPDTILQFLDSIYKMAGVQVNDDRHITDFLKLVEKYALGTFSSVLIGFTDLLLTVVVMYFLLYYMFVSFEIFEKTLFKYVPFSKKEALRFSKEFKNSTYSNIIGQGIIAIVQGAMVGVGFLIFRIDGFIFYTIIAIVLSFVPVVGAAAVYVPASLYLFSTGHNYNGWGMLIWGAVVVSNIDNVLRLVINKKVADTHPIITIMGVIIGIPLFGIVGLVLGPLLLSYFVILVQVYESAYIHPDS